MKPAQRYQHGQALIFAAIVLPFLMLLLLTGVEYVGRTLQRSDVEDALHDATRSVVQSFHYERFAHNEQGLRTEQEIKQLARQLFLTNLQSVGGLARTPDEVVNLVQWTILPNGGTCPFRDTAMTFTTPAVCASLDVPLTGLVGWGEWSAHLEVAATIDRP